MRRRSSKVRPLQNTTSQEFNNIGRGNNGVTDKKDNGASLEENKLINDFVHRSEIKKKAIQVFYTENMEKNHGKLNNNALNCNPNYILHPSSWIRRIFDCVTAVWVLTLVFFIPFLIGFDWYAEPSGQKIFLNLLDIWFAVDILMNFRTGYIHHGTIIMTPKKVFWNYLTTWFLIDLMGTFPFEKLIKGEATSRKSLKLIKYFKIPKLLRVSRLMKYVRDHRQVYDIFQVFVLVLTSLHLGACFWVLIINPCGDDDIDTALCKQENIFNLYVESFHLSAVMILGISNYHVIGASASSGMLINETEQVKMYIVSTIYMIGGLCLIAFLISELNVFLFGKKQGSAAFQRKIDRVSYEMEYYGVPDDIQRQVKAFYDYIWIHQKQYDDEIALLSDDQMSTDLQRKLALYLFKDVVSHISLFSEIDDLLLGEICLSLRTRIFLPQDMILFKGDVGKELFIIAKGVVEVLRDDLSPPQRQKAPPILLKSGSFFGEIALIMETRRTCSVQARTICETNILEQDTFDTILQRNPDFAKRMNELVVARQLERSLTKSDEQGCVEDVRVSQVDMANAISAVDKNMKKGLERRLHHNVKSSDFSPENGVFPFKQNNNSVENNANEKICHDMGIEHPKLCSDHMRSSTLKALTSKNSSDNTSANANEDTSINDGNEEFSRIIDDIARRSAHNVHNFQEMSECSTGRKRTNSSSSNDLETGKKLHPNSPPKRYHQNDSAYFNDCDGEDVETMLVTGHFIPDKVMLDIKKVHPTILNGGNVDSSSCSMNKKLRKIETQLLIQEHLMKSILSKMETQNNANSDEAST